MHLTLAADRSHPCELMSSFVALKHLWEWAKGLRRPQDCCIICCLFFKFLWVQKDTFCTPTFILPHHDLFYLSFLVRYELHSKSCPLWVGQTRQTDRPDRQGDSLTGRRADTHAHAHTHTQMHTLSSTHTHIHKHTHREFQTMIQQRCLSSC